MKRIYAFALFAALPLAAGAQPPSQTSPTGGPAGAAGPLGASAELKNAKGENVGTATLTQVGNVVKMDVSAIGLDKGKHGIHIHEQGKCDGPDFKSAGAHFNPHGKKHGTKADGGAHAGDMPNLEVGESGKASFKGTLHGVTLAKGEKNSLLDDDGSAVVIHAKEDDEKTDPSGNSGDRIICGVIK